MPQRRKLRRPRPRRNPEGTNPLSPLPRDPHTIDCAVREASLQQLIAAKSETARVQNTEEYRWAWFSLTGAIGSEIERRWQARLEQPGALTVAEIASWGRALDDPGLVKRRIDERRQSHPNVRAFEAPRKAVSNDEELG